MAANFSDFVTNFFNESLGLIWEKVVGPRPNSMSRQSESKKHNFLCPSKVLNTFLGGIPKNNNKNFAFKTREKETTRRASA